MEDDKTKEDKLENVQLEKKESYHSKPTREKRTIQPKKLKASKIIPKVSEEEEENEDEWEDISENQLKQVQTKLNAKVMENSEDMWEDVVSSKEKEKETKPINVPSIKSLKSIISSPPVYNNNIYYFDIYIEKRRS